MKFRPIKPINLLSQNLPQECCGMDETDFTQELLIESREGLGRLDQEIVQFEQNPRDARLLDSIFRTVHTIERTGGMLGFTGVESIAHLSETLLSQLRSGERDLTSQLVSLILKSVDAIKNELAAKDAGAAFLITKPFTPEAFRSALEPILGG